MNFLNYTLDDAKVLAAEAEIRLEVYSRLHLVAASILGTWLLIRLFDFYRDGDLSWAATKARLFRILISLPIVRSIAAKEMASMDGTVTKQCRKIYQGAQFLQKLPKKGLNESQIISELSKYQSLSKINWQQGRASGTVYSDLGAESNRIMTQVFSQTAYTNPLHPECFPGINKMEAEVVRMVCGLFHGDDKSCGTLTSGGTESIVLAVKAYRDYARQVRGITRPELVAPVSAHAAFQKACQYFCIKYRAIRVNPATFAVDLAAMKSAITSNTIALVGSACGYPHGIVDPIEDIARLGLRYGVPVHVDSCLGGFIVPFLEDAGFGMKPVDFRVEGVTSISADTHKYGYAPKGSSVIMYADKKYRKHQFSVQTDWPGGIYASPTISGSRAGAAIATCWAALMHRGYDGYVDATRRILTVQRWLKAEIAKVEGIQVMGDPQMTVIAIQSDVFNIFRLSDMLSSRGWTINPLQFPSAFHICLTLMHVQEGVAAAFLKDLQECTAVCMKEPSKSAEGMAVMYGMAQSIPDRTIVSDIACTYLNSIYETKD